MKDTATELHKQANVYAQAVTAGNPADAGPLLAAARAHLAEARPLDDILVEYTPLLDAYSAGEPIVLGQLQELMAELGPVRKATAILAGALPGTAPVVTTEKEADNGLV